jgi:hypothetical protein
MRCNVNLSLFLHGWNNAAKKDQHQPTVGDPSSVVLLHGEKRPSRRKKGSRQDSIVYSFGNWVTSVSGVAWHGMA